MATILIIDDDRQMRDILRQRLEREGHEVMEAPDGKVGLQLQKKTPFDLFITDIIMPEMEGIETIKILRHDYPELKIIACSGGGRIAPEGFLEMAGAICADRTFKKPFDQKEIVAAIDELPIDFMIGVKSMIESELNQDFVLGTVTGTVGDSTITY